MPPRAHGAILQSALALALLASAGCLGAQRTTADEPVGAGGLKPTLEDKDVGLVGLAPGFDLNSYRVILVGSFPVTDPAVKDEGDRKLADEMATFFQKEIIRRLRASALFTRAVNLAETEYKPDQERTLRLEGKITRLGEGSQAGRAFFGIFGAGRTRAQAEMSFSDAQSGQAVLVTADRRIASVGVFGGESRDHLKESFDGMASDLVKFLLRLSKGEAPKKE